MPRRTLAARFLRDPARTPRCEEVRTTQRQYHCCCQWYGGFQELGVPFWSTKYGFYLLSVYWGIYWNLVLVVCIVVLSIAVMYGYEKGI